MKNSGVVENILAPQSGTVNFYFHTNYMYNLEKLLMFINLYFSPKLRLFYKGAEMILDIFKTHCI